MGEAKDKSFRDMDEGERREYLEELGIEPKKVEEHSYEDKRVSVIEGEEDKGEEERRKEELKRYRQDSGY